MSFLIIQPKRKLKPKEKIALKIAITIKNGAMFGAPCVVVAKNCSCIEENMLNWMPSPANCQKMASPMSPIKHSRAQFRRFSKPIELMSMKVDVKRKARKNNWKWLIMKAANGGASGGIVWVA